MSVLGGAAGAGAGEPDRGDDLTYETVFGVWSDDPENSLCTVCSKPVDLSTTPLDQHGDFVLLCQDHINQRPKES